MKYLKKLGIDRGKEMEEKKRLIGEILELLDSHSSTKTDINSNYLEFFEIDDLLETRDGLLKRVADFKSDNRDFLDEIFSKCS